MEITLKPEAIQLGKRVYNSKDINSESKEIQSDIDYIPSQYTNAKIKM